MSSFNDFLKDTIMLNRNIEEELNCNYTKIYDLSKIDTREDLSFEEKRNILVTIKKILLSTSLYFCANKSPEIITYLLTKIILFLFFIFIYSPLYKYYFYPTDEERKSLNECSFWKKLMIFFIFYYLDRNPDISKESKVGKIMNFYAQLVVIERNKNNEKNDNLIFFNESNFSIFLIKKSAFHGRFTYPNIDLETINKLLEKKFYQYVINYPNIKYYKWDRKIINEKENTIVGDIINILISSDNKRFIFNIFRYIVISILYILSLNCLIEGKFNYCLIYRYSILIFNKVLSYFISIIYKNFLMEKEKFLSQKYIPDGYFIILNETIIQIFKLSDDYVDKTFNRDEIYKKINNEIDNLNQKII